MKKNILNLILAIVFMLSLVTPVFAVDAETHVHREVLGSISEDEGEGNVVTLETCDASVSPYSSRLMFSMATSASGVGDIYTTLASQKSFKKADVTNGYVKISGTYAYKNSTSSNYTIKIGVTIYNSVTTEFETTTEWSDYWKNNISSVTYIKAESLNDDVAYYGFGKNNSDGSVGKFTGSASYYNSTKS